MSSRPLLALLLLAAGCPDSGAGGDCNRDSDCASDQVCARDEACTPTSQVRSVSTAWTINSGDANVMSCAADPDLYITFYGADSGDTLGFAPVPCMNGLFSVDKLPTRFRQVELGVEGGTRVRVAIDATGNAKLDLRL